MTGADARVRALERPVEEQTPKLSELAYRRFKEALFARWKQAVRRTLDWVDSDV